MEEEYNDDWYRQKYNAQGKLRKRPGRPRNAHPTVKPVFLDENGQRRKRGRPPKAGMNKKKKDFFKVSRRKKNALSTIVVPHEKKGKGEAEKIKTKFDEIVGMLRSEPFSEYYSIIPTSDRANVQSILIENPWPLEDDQEEYFYQHQQQQQQQQNDIFFGNFGSTSSLQKSLKSTFFWIKGLKEALQQPDHHVHSLIDTSFFAPAQQTTISNNSLFGPNQKLLFSEEDEDSKKKNVDDYSSDDSTTTTSKEDSSSFSLEEENEEKENDHFPKNKQKKIDTPIEYFSKRFISSIDWQRPIHLPVLVRFGKMYSTTTESSFSAPTATTATTTEMNHEQEHDQDALHKKCSSSSSSSSSSSRHFIFGAIIDVFSSSPCIFKGVSQKPFSSTSNNNTNKIKNQEEILVPCTDENDQELIDYIFQSSAINGDSEPERKDAMIYLADDGGSPLYFRGSCFHSLNEAASFLVGIPFSHDMLDRGNVWQVQPFPETHPHLWVPLTQQALQKMCPPRDKTADLAYLSGFLTRHACKSVPLHVFSSEFHQRGFLPTGNWSEFTIKEAFCKGPNDPDFFPDQSFLHEEQQQQQQQEKEKQQQDLVVSSREMMAAAAQSFQFLKAFKLAFHQKDQPVPRSESQNNESQNGFQNQLAPQNGYLFPSSTFYFNSK